MPSGVSFEPRRAAAAPAPPSLLATLPFPILPLTCRILPCRPARRLLLGATAPPPPLLDPAFIFLLFLSSRCVLRVAQPSSTPMLLFLFSKAWSSDSTAICLTPHIPRQRDIGLKFRYSFSKVSKCRSNHKIFIHGCMSLWTYAPNIEIFLSFTYMFLTPHPAKRRPSQLKPLVPASVLNTLLITFARQTLPPTFQHTANHTSLGTLTHSSSYRRVDVPTTPNVSRSVEPQFLT